MRDERDEKGRMMKMEIESQIDKIGIPNLVPANAPKIVSHISQEDDEDLDEYLYNLGYSKYFLDQFEAPLQKNSKKLKLLDDGFYKLKKESDYISFLEKIFNDNDLNVLLFNLGIDFSDIEACIDKIERLDKIDQYIILNINKTYRDSEAYLISDNTLLKFFIKGFLREAISGMLYFEKLDIFVSYGFDMTLPIYIKNNDYLEKYKNVARKFNVYLRK